MEFSSTKVTSALLSVALFILMALYMYSIATYEANASMLSIKVADLALWLATLLAVCKSYVDYCSLGSRAKLLSSLTTEIVFSAVAFVARVVLTLECLARYYFMAPLIGCLSIMDFLSPLGVLVTYSLFVVSFLSIAHSLGVVANIHGETLANLVRGLRESILRCARSISTKHVVIVCFAIGFVARLIPELVYWPWPIGWDTIEYIAHLRDFALSLNPFISYPWLTILRNLPPLFDILLGYVSRFVDPWWLLKIYPALVMGLLCALLGYVSIRAFEASISTALMVALATALNMIVIGSSYQWHRHMLGLTMLALYLAIHYSSKRNPILEALALVAMAMAYEPTAAIAILLSLVMLVYTWKKGKEYRIAYAIALAISTTLLARYCLTVPGVKVYGVTLPGIVEWRFNVVTYSTVKWILIYLVPLFPAIAALYPKGPRLYTFVCALLFLVAIEPAFFPYLCQLPYRWYSMLIPLLIPPAFAALEKFDRRVQATLLLSIVIPGAIFVYIPSTPYMKGVEIDLPKGFPWKLEPVFYIASGCEVAKYVATHAFPRSMILTPLALIPFLHLEIRFLNTSKAIICEDPIKAALQVFNETHHRKYIVLTMHNLSKDVELHRQDIEQRNLKIHLELVKSISIWNIYELTLIPQRASNSSS